MASTAVPWPPVAANSAVEYCVDTARGPLPAEGSRRLARIEALFESAPAPAGGERELEIVEE